MYFSKALILSVLAIGVFSAPLLDTRHHTEKQIEAVRDPVA